MGHTEDDAVYKIPHKMKTHWQNQLKISVLVQFKIHYRKRYKKINVILVQCPFKNSKHIIYYTEVSYIIHAYFLELIIVLAIHYMFLT